MEKITVEYIFKEAKIRIWWSLLSIILTSLISYFFSEELLFFLTKPFLDISKASFFLCTRLTESLSTYIFLSMTLSFFFCLPFLLYQSWCFFIPSCHKTLRLQIGKFLIFSGMALLFMLLVAFLWILPNVWSFLYNLSNIGAKDHVFTMKLQPRIFDFTRLTMHLLLLALICSQIPILLFSSIQYGFISIKTLLTNRSIACFFSALLAALVTPPDIWCQFIVWLCIIVFLELTIFLGIIQLEYTKKTKIRA